MLLSLRQIDWGSATNNRKKSRQLQKICLQKIRQTINDEILSQMKSETADAEKLEAVLTGSFEQLRAKLPKFANSFAKFHATLTPEQRAKIVDKMEKRRKRSEKGDWSRHRGGLWH